MYLADDFLLHLAIKKTTNQEEPGVEPAGADRRHLPRRLKTDLQVLSVLL